MSSTKRLFPVDPATERRLEGYGFQPEGEPYEPNQAVFKVTLPASVFSSVFLAPLLIDADQRRQKHYIFTLLLPQYMSYIVCLIFQISFVVTVRSLALGMKTAVCGDEHWYLRILCLLVSVGSITVDLLQTAYMIFWVRCLPTFDPKIHSYVLQYCSKHTGRTSIPFQKWKNSKGCEVTKPAAGISQLYRIYIYTCIILPKLMLAITLLVYGSVYVISAQSSGDLILNSMATVFILDLDDIIYNVLTPPLHKEWIETSSEITFDDDEQGYLHLYQPYIAMTAITVASIAIWMNYCN